MYVQRDEEDAIIGAFKKLQTEYAEEWVEDDDEELVAFLVANKVPTPAERIAEALARLEL